MTLCDVDVSAIEGTLVLEAVEKLRSERLKASTSASVSTPVNTNTAITTTNSHVRKRSSQTSKIDQSADTDISPEEAEIRGETILS